VNAALHGENSVFPRGRKPSNRPMNPEPTAAVPVISVNIGLPAGTELATKGIESVPSTGSNTSKGKVNNLVVQTGPVTFQGSNLPGTNNNFRESSSGSFGANTWNSNEDESDDEDETIAILKNNTNNASPKPLSHPNRNLMVVDMDDSDEINVSNTDSTMVYDGIHVTAL